MCTVQDGKKEPILPIWPTKAVSTSAAMGSAASASTAGAAMLRISIPTVSSLSHPGSVPIAVIASSSSFLSGSDSQEASSSSSTTPLAVGFARHRGVRRRGAAEVRQGQGRPEGMWTWWTLRCGARVSAAAALVGAGEVAAMSLRARAIRVCGGSTGTWVQSSVAERFAVFVGPLGTGP